MQTRVIWKAFGVFEFWFLSLQAFTVYSLLMPMAMGWDLRGFSAAIHGVCMNMGLLADAYPPVANEAIRIGWVVLSACNLLLAAGFKLNWFVDITTTHINIFSVDWEMSDLIFGRLILLVLFGSKYVFMYIVSPKDSMLFSVPMARSDVKEKVAFLRELGLLPLGKHKPHKERLNDKRLRGCHTRSEGEIFDSETSFSSSSVLPTGEEDDEIEVKDSGLVYHDSDLQKSPQTALSREPEVCEAAVITAADIHWSGAGVLGEEVQWDRVLYRPRSSNDSESAVGGRDLDSERGDESHQSSFNLDPSFRHTRSERLVKAVSEPRALSNGILESSHVACNLVGCLLPQDCGQVCGSLSPRLARSYHHGRPAETDSTVTL
eukprot:2289339-Rhodomonas_salina.1